MATVLFLGPLVIDDTLAPNEARNYYMGPDADTFSECTVHFTAHYIHEPGFDVGLVTEVEGITIRADSLPPHGSTYASCSIRNTSSKPISQFRLYCSVVKA